MSRRKAPYVKQAMREAALEIISNPDEHGRLTSRKIVELVKKKQTPEVDRDHDEIHDVGLMVLAGRVMAKPIENEKIRSMLNGENIREFLLLHPNPEGNEESGIINSFSLRPDDNYPLRRQAERPRSSRRTEEDKLDEIMRRMKDQGYGHLTIGEYINL